MVHSSPSPEFRRMVLRQTSTLFPGNGFPPFPTCHRRMTHARIPSSFIPRPTSLFVRYQLAAKTRRRRSLPPSSSRRARLVGSDTGSPDHMDSGRDLYAPPSTFPELRACRHRSMSLVLISGPEDWECTALSIRVQRILVCS